MLKILVPFALFFTALPALLAQVDESSRGRNQPVPPFQIAGNLYYVGANEVASYLITAPEGHLCSADQLDLPVTSCRIAGAL